jgi:hypothetical protein
LLPKERRVVVEATSQASYFIGRSFCRVSGLERSPASALGAVMSWMLHGKRRMLLCAGIAAAEGNFLGIATQRVKAGNGGSKLMAVVSASLADSPRY